MAHAHLSIIHDIISGGLMGNTEAVAALEQVSTIFFFILEQWGIVGDFLKVLENPPMDKCVFFITVFRELKLFRFFC